MSAHHTLVGHTHLVHRALLRLFDQVVEARVDDATRLVGARAAAVALRAHHLMEDELILPVLRASGTEGPWDQLASDHEDLARHLAAAEASGDRAALEAIREALPAHFALEEEQLTEAFWRGVLDDDEAKALGREVSTHSRAHLKPTAQQLPLLLYNLDEVERARFTERMPGFVVNGLVPFAFRGSWRSLRPFMAFPPRRLLGRS